MGREGRDTNWRGSPSCGVSIDCRRFGRQRGGGLGRRL